MKDVKVKFFVGLIILSGIVGYIIPEMNGLGKIITRLLLIVGLMFLAKINLTTIKEKMIDFKSKFRLASKDIIISVIISATMTIALSNIMFFCFYLWKPEILTKFVEVISNKEISIYAEIMVLVLSVIIGPIVEELIFRGIIFTKLLKRMKIVTAMIISSVIFGVGHLSPAIIGAIISGFLWCILYMKYKNILVTMLLHSVSNLIVRIPSFVKNIFDTDKLIDVSMDTISYTQLKIEFIIGIVLLLISFTMLAAFIKKNIRYIK